ncbi:hypothetical protein NE586_11795 [Gemmiger formicilis]|uniref:hypothetical protein n=1 Tax=Gemmiger formicilis TaxID=745368 RepID=UPI0021087DC0|nr:hypothetical protein [Gemmiger formicilis]MCQ5080567.1 hypothetical protein [Gemmiger formicilis]MCQ5116159.1 hypothetical protein [Gemmiger formicilis]
MKKLVTLLLTAALAITAATTAFADHQIGPDANGNPNPASKAIPVTYTVAPKYTVTIPASVTLDSDSKSSTATIVVKDVTVDFGKKVKVALNKGTFNVTTDEGATLPCKVTKGTNKTPVNDNGTVLEVAPASKSGSETLTFAITDPVVYSGTYKGTVTFEVSVG